MPQLLLKNTNFLIKKIRKLQSTHYWNVSTDPLKFIDQILVTSALLYPWYS